MLEEKVVHTIKKYQMIKPKDIVLAAVSGGPDSMAMLVILKELSKKMHFEVQVAHVNHGLRENAKKDQEYLSSYCKREEIHFHTKEFDIKKIAHEQKMGTEETGRMVRYQFFEEVKNQIQANKIAIAHNANDNCETVLMNILRGSGTIGLKGIEPIREQKYIRPLIECTRDEIEQFCQERNLQPCIDETNLQNIYTRNKIRNQLIPLLKKEYNPNIIESINRLSAIATEETNYIQKEAIKTYQKVLIEEREKEIQFDLKKFNQFDTVIKKRVLLYTVNRLKGSSKGIEKKHLEDILKLCQNNIGNKFLIPQKNLKILVKNKKIFLQLLS